MKVPRAPHQKSVTINRKRQSFAVNLGGLLDESNTVTRQPKNYCPGRGHRNPPHDQVFEPNVYVAIENCGGADLVNPALVANGQRNWWSLETMTDEIRRNAGGKRATETEVAIAFWQFVSQELYDQREGKGTVDSVGDPVRLPAHILSPMTAHGRDIPMAYAVATLEVVCYPIIEKHLSREECDYDSNVCQKEVKKAKCSANQSRPLPPKHSSRALPRTLTDRTHLPVCDHQESPNSIPHSLLPSSQIGNSNCR